MNPSDASAHASALRKVGKGAGRRAAGWTALAQQHMRAAVESGLGLTCRTGHFLGGAIQSSKLPPLPRVAFAHHVRPNAHSTIRRLGDLIQSAARGLA